MPTNYESLKEMHFVHHIVEESAVPHRRSLEEEDDKLWAVQENAAGTMVNMIVVCYPFKIFSFISICIEVQRFYTHK